MLQVDAISGIVETVETVNSTPSALIDGVADVVNGTGRVGVFITNTSSSVDIQVSTVLANTGNGTTIAAGTVMYLPFGSEVTIYAEATSDVTVLVQQGLKAGV